MSALVDEGILPPVAGLILNEDYIRHTVQGSTAYQLFWVADYDRFKEQGKGRRTQHQDHDSEETLQVETQRVPAQALSCEKSSVDFSKCKAKLPRSPAGESPRHSRSSSPPARNEINLAEGPGASSSDYVHEKARFTTTTTADGSETNIHLDEQYHQPPQGKRPEPEEVQRRAKIASLADSAAQ